MAYSPILRVMPKRPGLLIAVPAEAAAHTTILCVITSLTGYMAVGRLRTIMASLVTVISKEVAAVNLRSPADPRSTGMEAEPVEVTHIPANPFVTPMYKGLVTITPMRVPRIARKIIARQVRRARTVLSARRKECNPGHIL